MVWAVELRPRSEPLIAGAVKLAPRLVGLANQCSELTAHSKRLRVLRGPFALGDHQAAVTIIL